MSVALQQKEEEYPMQEKDLIYALDIGTRSVIGMLGRQENGRVHILAVEKQPHERRSMLDGQIEDIDQVAATVTQITRRLEADVGRRLTQVCVAAAGRSLRTEHGSSRIELSAPEVIGDEQVQRLTAEAVANAASVLEDGEESAQRMLLVGYTATQLRLDQYPLSKLQGHTGSLLEAEVVATFLPSEVVDSLYAVLRAASLEVASLTLEPIAALNAAIPADLRLLNLALVDIGAGTSDIAVCRDGSVVGYTMATTAGDEITEALMRSCLVDYPTAESIKARLSGEGEITYQDILGLEQVQNTQQLRASVEPAVQALAGELAERITALNGGPPSAVFLAGGGSKLSGLNARLAAALGLDEKRIAVAGRYFQTSAVSDAVELDDPVYTTPLGIAISALGAYGVVRFFPRFGKKLTRVLVTTYMFPPILLAVPYSIIMGKMGLMNNRFGLMVVYLSFSVPYAIWLLVGFFKTVPLEIEEAAKVDGAGKLQTFQKVVLPIVAPGIVAVAIYTFINAWNEFLYSLILMNSSSKMTVAVALKSLEGQEVLDWGVMMAASAVVVIPSVIFFMLIQKKIAGGLAQGSIK